MIHFTVERFPDAQRTMLRFALCFVLPFALGFAMLRGSSAGYDPVLFHDFLYFQQWLNAGLALVGSTFFVALFSMWQCGARNPLADEGCLGWLSIHGWDGRVDTQPQRGLLPISELIGMLIVTLSVGRYTTAAFVFLPMIWSLVRLEACGRQSCREAPFAFGSVWLLHATAILWTGRTWLAIPVELMAILLSEFLMVFGLQQKLKEMLTSDVTLAAKPTLFGMPIHQPNQQRTTSRDVQRLFPFAQLRPDVKSARPSWKVSTWIALIVALWMFCVASRMLELEEYAKTIGSPTTFRGNFAVAGMSVVTFIGIVMTVVQYEPLVWGSRLSVWSRIRMRRPVVWSWDRILIPHAINIAFCCLIGNLGMSLPPVVYAACVFAQVLLILRGGVTSEEWQMTADSRLTTMFLDSGSKRAS